MVLGIIGSRSRDSQDDYELVLKKVRELKPDKIVSGGCYRGADRFAEIIADMLKIPITIYKPQIENFDLPYYKAVKLYYKRNRQIVDNVDMLLAVMDKNNPEKGGTAYTVKYFLKNKPNNKLIRL